MENLDLLSRLVDAPGVPGREGAVRDVIRTAIEAQAFFDHIETDVLGNLICTRSGQGGASSRTILLAAHMDQAGFLVSCVTEEGAIWLHPVGTFDPRAMGSQPVSVITATGQVYPGTLHIAAAPIHTASAQTLETKITLENLFVDIGLPGPEVRAKVAPGDSVVFRSALMQVGSHIAGAGLDDRVGCWALIRALPLIRNNKDTLVCAFTVQEELGSRGVGAVAERVRPDIAIISECVVSAAVPGVPDHQQITTPGKGIALQVADSALLSDPALITVAQQAAAALKIPVQHSLMQGGGQDGAIVQRSGTGVRVIALGCPVKYMHAAREHAHLEDVENYPPLIAALVDAV